MAQRDHGLFTGQGTVVRFGQQEDLAMFHRRTSQRLWNNWMQRVDVTPESEASINEIEFTGEGEDISRGSRVLVMRRDNKETSPESSLFYCYLKLKNIK
ncbi:hypothetical protein PV326_012868 [Microctonus aethiopoides]|nr:hypothetical protein PV326_012868 [Microctonus aethiopoides]